MDKTKTTTLKSTKLEFSHQQLHEALLYAEDALDRALIPFIVLGDIAKQLRQEDIPQFKADGIQLAVRERHLSDSPLSILRMRLPEAAFGPTAIKFLHGSVPVVIKIITLDYKFFRTPDVRNYYLSAFFLPNPFEDYWRARSLLR